MAQRQTSKSRVARERQETVLAAAKEAGIASGRRVQIGARLHEDLLEAARANTGLDKTTDLLEYALAKVALEDHFVETLLSSKGKLPPDLDLEF